MLGWWTILQLLVRRAAESIAFSVPDRNALWSRTEDDLLVQAVAKYRTSNILGRHWIEVAWEMSGSLPQQCQECYRLAHILADLTFVFLRATFRDSPLLRFSHVLTKDTDAVDSARPIHSRSSPCSRSSLSHAHRFMGSFRNQNGLPETSVILTISSASDSQETRDYPGNSGEYTRHSVLRRKSLQILHI